MADEVGISGLKKLDDCPNGDVLEGLIRTAEEAVEIRVETSIGAVPNIVESGIVIGR